MIYKSSDLIRIARRSNNAKREYIVVNPRQGKHIPVRPGEALKMMRAFGRLIKNSYPDERLLCIGFAETATAIGAAAARHCGNNYIHTTREDLGGDCFVFSEEHSHAPEQKIYSGGFDALLEKINRIVFVEDEISTGKTVREIVTLLRKYNAVPDNMRFSAASLINMMREEDLYRFVQADIEPLFLVKSENNGFEAQALSYKTDNLRMCDMRSALPVSAEPVIVSVLGKLDPRQGVNVAEYEKACYNLAVKIAGKLNIAELPGEEILVLGTEECMYPALYAARYFEGCNPRIKVYTHATTRTPIAPSREDRYPITGGCFLRSVYDVNRTTFLYNLKRYDSVILVTDSDLSEEKLRISIGDIQAAFMKYGTDNFMAVRWTF
jgi:adenine/guanine phosphoribosyltransferase-like PRPP-binding protein